jgi:hypothetical protein
LGWAIYPLYLPISLYPVDENPLFLAKPFFGYLPIPLKKDSIESKDRDLKGVGV